MKPKKCLIYNILLLLCLINIKANALSVAGIDTIYKEQIIKVGQQKLNTLILQNEQYLKEGKTDKLNFVVNVNPEDYISDVIQSGRPTFLSSATVEGNYNARLNQIYQSEGIECYYLLINYFDVKMKAEMPATFSLNELFNEGSFFDKNSNIQSLKFLHETITRNIITTPISSNRKRMVVSFANYCSAEFNNTTGGTGCFRLYSLNKVEPNNSAAIAYFDNTFDYYKGYLKKDQSFLQESSRDLIVDKMIIDFEKSVKNYKKKALILQTNTTAELKTILSFFGSEDYKLLSNQERAHIFKVFCSGAILHTTEIEILSILNTVSRDSVNTILTDLVTINVNSKRILKHFFNGFQQGNYQELVKRLTELVGNSTLYQHNLPDVEASLTNNQISPAWSRVFEWSDCSTSTMYMDEQNTDECKRPSSWEHAEKRYFTITINDIGSIEINGKYKKVEATFNGYNTTYENITPASLNPYDLVVLVDKTTISGLNDITETSGGTMVVPAFFLVYAKDKAFNRDVFDGVMALTSVVGPEEILASKLLSKISGFKRLLKFFRKTEVLNEAGNSFFKTVDEFALTFDKAGTVSQSIKNQAYDLYNQGKWSELETLFKNNNLNKSGTTVWPPANGGYNIVDNVDIKAGMKFDRYGGANPGWNGQGVPPLGGNFTSPMMQSGSYSFGQRALNQAENEYDFYYEIEVLKDLPFKGQTADVIPWFGQVGGGKQTMWNIPKVGNYPKTWNMLAAEGYVKITIKSSPSGNFQNLVNTVIQ